MREEVRRKLVDLSEERYRKFSSSLTPGEKNMLGVRLPVLREMAKKLARGNWKEELSFPDVYFEETMLRGMVISYATLSMRTEEALTYIGEFIPLVTNWSVCDSVFMKMNVLRQDREKTWNYVLAHLESGEEFRVRVALVIMMQHLMKCDKNGCKMKRLRTITMTDVKNYARDESVAGPYLKLIFQKIDRCFFEGYYAYMAAAWLVAECFCCFPAMTDTFLGQCQMDDKTYNKALQKIIESRILDEEVKQYIRGRKKGGKRSE